MRAQFLRLALMLPRNLGVLFGLQPLLLGRPRFHIREAPLPGCSGASLLEPPGTRARRYNRDDSHEGNEGDDQDDDE
ncbi:hypothetical protein [Gaiella sp.]|uniref:hypothetical protein n=1 Tax=Gaiella sp. TaxID=2663207 RepID=UPI003265911E